MITRKFFSLIQAAGAGFACCCRALCVCARRAAAIQRGLHSDDPIFRPILCAVVRSALTGTAGPPPRRGAIHDTSAARKLEWRLSPGLVEFLGAARRQSFLLKPRAGLKFHDARTRLAACELPTSTASPSPDHLPASRHPAGENTPPSYTSRLSMPAPSR